MAWYELAVSYLITLLNVYFSYCVIKQTKNLKETTTLKLICSIIIVFSFFEIIIKYTDVLRLVTAYLSMIIIFFVNDKINIKYDIIAYSFLNIYGILLEIILIIIISSLFPLNYTSMPFVVEQFVAIVFAIIWLSSWCFFEKLVSFTKLFKKIEKLISHIFTIEVFIILIFISISTLSVDYFLGNVSSKIVMIYILIINILFLVVLICIKNINKKEQLQIQNDTLISMVDEYEKLVEEYREMKHNLMSDFLIIKSVANEECSSLIDYKICEYSKNYHWINELSKVPKGIQGLIFAKNNIAAEKKVKIFIKAKSQIKELSELLNHKIYNDFYKIFSLLMDNAIEAASQSKQKNIIVDVSSKDKTIYIRLCNAFSNKVDLDKIGKKGYSTKGKSRGIGLNYVLNKTSKEIKVCNHIVNDVYEVTISVKIKRAN